MTKHIPLIFLALVAATSANAGPATDCDREREADNKVVAGKVFEEILSQGRIDENEHLYHADFVAHGPRRDADRAEDRAASAGWRLAVPDLRMEVLRMVAECDHVAVHWSGSGTNTGTGNGLPATGKHLEKLWGMTIFRLEGGQIREEWTSFDQYAMLQQLGLLPGQDQIAP